MALLVIHLLFSPSDKSSPLTTKQVETGVLYIFTTDYTHRYLRYVTVLLNIISCVLSAMIYSKVSRFTSRFGNVDISNEFK